MQKKWILEDITEKGNLREVFHRLKHNGNVHGEYRREFGKYGKPPNHRDPFLRAYSLQDFKSRQDAIQPGLQETGWYNNGKKHGTFTKYNIRTGKPIWECDFQNDLKHGNEYEYVSSGTCTKPIKSITWYCGKKNGQEVHCTYATNSTIPGEKIITCYKLWDHGQLLEQTNYISYGSNADKKVTYTCRLPDGQSKEFWTGTTRLKEQIAYFKGKKHGARCVWSETGTLQLSEMYAEGRLVSRDFVANPELNQPFSDGVKNGWRGFYSETGEYLHKAKFTNDLLVENSWSSDPL